MRPEAISLISPNEIIQPGFRKLSNPLGERFPDEQEADQREMERLRLQEQHLLHLIEQDHRELLDQIPGHHR